MKYVHPGSKEFLTELELSVILSLWHGTKYVHQYSKASLSSSINATKIQQELEQRFGISAAELISALAHSCGRDVPVHKPSRN